MNLREYQIKANAEIVKGFAAGQNRLLLQMATGTGKTVTFARLGLDPGLLELLGGRARTLVIAHREELLDQAYRKIQDAQPNRTIGIEQGERFSSAFADITIASIQTLAARHCRRLDQLLRGGAYQLVIVDEAHHAAAPSYRNVLVRLGFLPAADASSKTGIEAATFTDVAEMEKALAGWDETAPKDRLLLGVTATPNRTDAIGLACVFQSMAFSYPLREAIDDGWLVPPVAWGITTGVALDAVKMSHGDFNQQELANVVNTDQRNAIAVSAWQQAAAGRQTIAFTVDVKHAHDLASEFRLKGVRAQAISGETPKDDRRAALRQYEAGEIQVLTNCMVLTEGTDLPVTGCILHAKPTQSATLYEQMTGRGLRLHPGKTDCLVLDVVDISRKHAIQTAPTLYGLPPGLLGAGETLARLAEGFDALLGRGLPVGRLVASSPMTLDALNMRAVKIQQALGPAPTVKGRALAWLDLGDGRFRVSYPWVDGKETIEVAPDLVGRFEVVLTLRRLDGTKAQRTLSGGLRSADACLALAEGFVATQRQRAARMASPDAPWKQRPATEKQIDRLRAMRVPFRLEGLTAGMASDLIDRNDAKRGR